MIYIVRHGQTDWNVEHRKQGQIDIPLNEAGKNEARLCGEKIATLHIDQIISSDLSRAKETANIINEFFSVPVHFDSRLREINFGDLQGIFGKDMTEELWHILNYEPKKIHAESLGEVCERVKSFFAELDSTKDTLIVTHGGVIRMVMYLSCHPQSFDVSEFEHVALQFRAQNTGVFSWDGARQFQALSDEFFEKSDNLEKT